MLAAGSGGGGEADQEFEAGFASVESSVEVIGVERQLAREIGALHTGSLRDQDVAFASEAVHERQRRVRLAGVPGTDAGERAGQTNSISAPISLAAGTYTMIVRAWNSTGAYGDQTFSLTVQ